MPTVNDDAPELRSELQTLGGELRSEMATMRVDLLTEIAGLRADLNDKTETLAGMIDSVAKDTRRLLAQQRADIATDTQRMLSNEITRAVNAIYERAQSNFTALDDQAKAVTERQAQAESDLAQVRGELDAHRTDRGLHRRR